MKVLVEVSGNKWCRVDWFIEAELTYILCLLSVMSTLCNSLASEMWHLVIVTLTRVALFVSIKVLSRCCGCANCHLSPIPVLRSTAARVIN